MTFNNTTPVNFLDAQSNGRASSGPFVDIFLPRDPTPSDITTATAINNYAIQQKWLNTTTNALWELKNYTTSAGVLYANWIMLANHALVTESLRDQNGVNDVFPDATNEINLIGDGTYIVTTGDPATNTMTISLTGAVTTLYTENTGTATPMGGNLNVLGTGPITTTGSGNTITIASNGTIATVYDEDTGSAIPSGGILNVIGGTGISTSGSGNTITITGTLTPFNSIKNQVFTTSGTYIPTSGMVYCQITMLGGGGAGGGAPAGISLVGSGGGGAGGEYAVGIFSAATIGGSQTVTIGAAGTGAAGSVGGNGGNTSVGALISANGGTGGTIASGTTITVSQGGNGGAGGSGGDYRTPGDQGQTGFGSITPPLVFGGEGANTQLGAGGGTGGAGGPGATALGYGSGGGGSATYQTTSTFPGGNGTSGIVIIQEFISV